MNDNVRDDYTYIGEELDVFSYATNWKTYWSSTLAKYMGATVLEVGAGIGTNTQLLCNDSYQRWLATEPDTAMYHHLGARQANGDLPAICEFSPLTVGELPSDDQFDTIMYIDVLEHIEHDADELRHAAAHLKTGGYLIVLCPAYQFLYTAFDEAIGHYRRYTASMFCDITPPDCTIEKLYYLDSVGLLASLANQLLLQQSTPAKEQILFWDRAMVPISRIVDSLIFRRAGRSVIGIWRKD